MSDERQVLGRVDLFIAFSKSALDAMCSTMNFFMPRPPGSILAPQETDETITGTSRSCALPYPISL